MINNPSIFSNTGQLKGISYLAQYAFVKPLNSKKQLFIKNIDHFQFMR